MRPICRFTDDELHAFIANHERLHRTDASEYADAVEELHRRKTTLLNIDRTIAAILKAAKEKRFLSYGDVAGANGLEWSFTVHHLMPKHLDLVLSKAHAHGRPLITSIVVNQGNVETGALDGSALKGFTACAERLGFNVSDPERLLREEQKRTFEFAAAHDGA